MADSIKQQTQPQESRKQTGLFVALGIVIICVIALAIAGFLFLRKPAEIIEGQAEATVVRVSGKLPGRVAEFYVREGDNVRKGDTLVHIHSSFVEAQMQQAQAVELASAAQNKKIDAGTRKQIVQGAYELWQQAIAAKGIAKKTYDRMEKLFNENVISAQKRDEAQAAYEATLAGERAAKSQYDLAVAGAQSEDKTSAAAAVEAARGGVAAVAAILEDQYLVAPCDGQIETIYPHEGELVAMGAPIMSVLRLDDKWVTFNVREEYLENLTMGKEIEVMIPALGKKTTKAKIFYINDMGTYATWRATKSTGQWDSRTFEIKAHTLDSLPDLRPGMSIVYFLDK